MSDINDYLQAMAFRNARFYSRNPHIKTIVLGGSVSLGRATRYSDIDTIIIYDEVPGKKFLEDASVHNAGRDWKILIENETGYVDHYYVNGIECQFSHGLVSTYEQFLENVLEKHTLDKISHLVLDGLSQAIPISGKRYFNTITKRLDNYPRDLAVNLVREHLHFPPLEEISHRLLKEDSLLRIYEILIKLQKNVLGILLGVNRMFIPGEYKKLDSLAGRMKIKPLNLSSRINDIYCKNPLHAIDELGELILETLDLVKESLPEIDTGPVREILNRKIRPITMHN